MKASFSSVLRLLGVGLLASGLSSCSLFRNGKYASQWEIQSDVPASLSSGEASAPPSGGAASGTVRSNLSGIGDPMVDAAGSMDLPVNENGAIIDVPKPELAMTGNVYGQSPPEMLNIPSSTGESDLPATGGAPHNLTTLLPGPPPVTEEELALAPEALTAPAPAPEAPAPADASAATVPAPQPAAAEAMPAAKPAVATTFPLLYGKLDLTPYLCPNPMALTTPPAPAPLAQQ